MNPKTPPGVSNNFLSLLFLHLCNPRFRMLAGVSWTKKVEKGGEKSSCYGLDQNFTGSVLNKKQA